jgi:hypothetical protein
MVWQIIVTVLAVVAVGVWLGGGEDGAPAIVQTLVTCTITPTVVITYTLGAWGRPKFLRPGDAPNVTPLFLCPRAQRRGSTRRRHSPGRVRV